MTHALNCAGARREECTCGLEFRIALETEKTMHAAWRKRAEEAEAELAAHRAAHETPERLVGYLYESERGHDWMRRPWSPEILRACLPSMTVTPLYRGNPMTRDQHIAQLSQTTGAPLPVCAACGHYEQNHFDDGKGFDVCRETLACACRIAQKTSEGAK